MNDPVGVDVEGHLDLGHAPRRGRNPDQFEPAQRPVVGRHGALALQDVDAYRRLVVRGGRKDLAFLGRDRCVLFDQFRQHAAKRLDAQRQGRDVQKQDILDVPGQNAALDCGSDCHDFIGIDALVGLLPEDLLDLLLDPRHAGHPADEDDLVDLRRREVGVFQGRAAGAFDLVDQVFHERLQLGPGQLDVHVLGTAGIRRDEGQVDVRLHGRGQLHLGLFRRLLEALQGHLVAPNVDALVLLEFRGQKLDEPLVEVLAAQVGVAIGRFDLENALAQLQDRNVERSPAQVEDGDLLVLLLVQAVSQGGRRRLVDDPEHVQAGDLAGVLGGLPLGVVEVGRHGDDRVRDFFAQIVLGGLFHLHQDHRRNFRGAVISAPDRHLGIPVRRFRNLEGAYGLVILDFTGAVLPSDHPLDGINGVLGVRNCLPLGDLADQPLATVRESNHGGRRAVPLLIGYNDGISTFHDGDTRICRSQINPYNLAHLNLSSLS